jgi:MFS family permease
MILSQNAWIMWLCATIFYAYQYLLRVIPSVLKDDLTATFHFDAFFFGQFSGIWYIGYTLAHIPIGIALDRYGPKYVLPICLCICSLGLSFLLISENPLHPILGRFIWGAGSTGATLGMFKVVQIAFPKDMFSKIISFSCTIGVLGAVFGSGPFMLYLISFYHWKFVITIIVMFGFILAFIMYFIFPSSERIYAQKPLQNLKTILKNRNLWLISLGSGFFAGPLEGFADAWATHALIDIYKLSALIASQGPFIIFGSLIIGLMAISYISKQLGNLKTTAIYGVLMLIAFSLILTGNINLYVLYGCFIILGFCSAYQVPAIESTMRLFKDEMSGLATAIFNMIMMIFGAFFHTVIGTSIQMMKKSDEIGLEVYQYGFSIIPLMLFLGISIFIFLQKRSNLS